MDKYQLAIVKYGETQKVIKVLSRKIGELLGECVIAHFGNNADENSKPCLFEGYAKTNRYREDMYDDVRDYLCEEKDDCKFCLEADELIQQRKLARQAFGHAKRQITKLANGIKP